MQRLEIIGHIGQDAEVKDFGDNQVINFSVAVSESYTNKQGEKITNTTWFECAKWGNNTAVSQYLKKGQQVYVSGKPQVRAWQKDDGTLVASQGLNVFTLQLLGPKNDSQPNATNNSPTPQANQSNSFVDAPSTNLNEDDSDDGLPF